MLFKFYIREISQRECIIFQSRYTFSGPVEESSYRDAVKNGKLIMATSPGAAADIYEMFDGEGI